MPDWLREDVRAAATVAVGTVLLGAPAGLLWVWLTPRIDTIFDAEGRPGLRVYESGQFFTVDVVFLLVTSALGIVCGLSGARLLRRRGPILAVGLLAGAIPAAFVARTVGERVVTDERTARFCATVPEDGFCRGFFDGTVDLRSPTLVLGWSFAALVAYAAVAFFADRPDEELVDAPGPRAVRQVGQL